MQKAHTLHKTTQWVHKSFQPTSRAGSTWSKFGAHGEHGEHGERGEDGKHGYVLRFSNLCVLWFSENRALVLGFKGLGKVEGSGVCTILTRHTSINQMTQKCGRLLKEKSKLTFVDVLIKIFNPCLLEGSQE